ncbi:hypothetical protein MJO28_014057 [Puccinia striiformis f. sp. tritici]|uniref:Peptide hydrolase n=2 Tax=Puccinia striiformis f. sp. tritici TaxID=168172 RepID=A0A0L0W0Y8_9BASI|nr:hypothetical protein Pst134EB_026084 [Puccinia striiformis f. sp. tritici]KAI7940405.1 hypothetical protein MJO28_014057 [Puccinia striiformis f. sp. tritici]KAI7941821.1 hypothetical protein MJO29_013895 [Puccinia striiformis f. sp. tritici]KAI9627376.1 hypothetical protein KEM48_009863 [Puccinia striiformis f. sp. tritici PST-130]KNF05159.1 hypothetical protein PSTG_01786 [Puccinia striiformis f. sp. tritici PST-78]
MLRYSTISGAVVLLFLSASTHSSSSGEDEIIYEPPTNQINFQLTPASGAGIEALLGPDHHLDREKVESLMSDDHLDQFTQHVRAYPEKRLIRWADGRQEWITEGEKAVLIFKDGRRKFVDITDSWIANDLLNSAFTLDSDPQLLNPNFVSHHDQLINKDSDSFPKKIKYGAEKLANFTGLIQTSRMEQRLSKFTDFKTRYYRSSTGKESQAWLLNEIRTLVSKSESNVTVSEFPHKWGQNTIIARFEPKGNAGVKEEDDESTFIVGAHQDSTNMMPFLPAPGADDDGSGSISILEAFDILLHHNWNPAPQNGALEFMWFSAEEGGLLGSQEVARNYRKNNRQVSGMVQFDMTAFVKKGTTPSIGLVTDFVDPSLTQYLRLLIGEYLSIGSVNTKCGYACSDHASWININVPSAFAIESTFEDSNQKIHSMGDTIHQPEFSFDHMAEFSKLVISLAIELKGL